jgi:hypothetical protein
VELVWVSDARLPLMPPKLSVGSMSRRSQKSAEVCNIELRGGRSASGRVLVERLALFSKGGGLVGSTEQSLAVFPIQSGVFFEAACVRTQAGEICLNREITIVNMRCRKRVRETERERERERERENKQCLLHVSTVKLCVCILSWSQAAYAV